MCKCAAFGRDVKIKQPAINEWLAYVLIYSFIELLTISSLLAFELKKGPHSCDPFFNFHMDPPKAGTFTYFHI